MAPVPQKRPMIVTLFHAYCDPPHSRAINSITATGEKRRNPTGSSFVRAPNIPERDFGFFVLLLSGIWIASRRIAARPPIGRLM